MKIRLNLAVTHQDTDTICQSLEELSGDMRGSGTKCKSVILHLLKYSFQMLDGPKAREMTEQLHRVLCRFLLRSYAAADGDTGSMDWCPPDRNSLKIVIRILIQVWMDNVNAGRNNDQTIKVVMQL